MAPPPSAARCCSSTPCRWSYRHRRAILTPFIERPPGMLLITVAAIFIVLILFSMPIVFALGVAGVAGLALGGYDLQMLSSSMVSGSQSWVLLAIPAFVFAGGLMEKCGMSHALVAVARAPGCRG